MGTFWVKCIIIQAFYTHKHLFLGLTHATVKPQLARIEEKLDQVLSVIEKKDTRSIKETDKSV